jgi:hypothetical protein
LSIAVNIAANILIVLFGFWVLRKARVKWRERARTAQLDQDVCCRPISRRFSFSFSLKLLWLSATEIPVALGMFAYMTRMGPDTGWEFLALVAVWTGSGVMFWSGVFALFSRPTLGAVIGFTIHGSIALMVIVGLFTHPAIG